MTEKSQNSHSTIYPTCKFEGRWLQTYDNETTVAKMDECFHVLTADCSYRKSFGILARNLTSGSDSSKEIKIYVGKTSIDLSPTSGHSQYMSSIKVKVNGSEIAMSQHSVSHYQVKDSKKDYVADIYK